MSFRQVEDDRRNNEREREREERREEEKKRTKKEGRKPKSSKILPLILNGRRE
jgi:hypothetical protein